MEGFFTKKEIPTSNTGKGLTCISCQAYKYCHNPKPKPIGEFKKKILLIGSTPNTADDRTGKIWQGAEGRLLRQQMKEVGIDVDKDCATIHAVKCSTEKITGKHIDCCRRKVHNDIKDLKPNLIIAFGIHALDSLIGNIYQKKLDGIAKWRGFQIPVQELNAWVAVTDSPSYINFKERPQEMLTVFTQDLKKALDKLKEPIPDYSEDEKKVEIIDNKSKVYDFFKELKNYPKFAWDIETTGLKPHDTEKHEIACISFAVSEDKSFCIPYYRNDKKYLKLLKNVLEGNQKKIAQNLKFEHTWARFIVEADVKNWYWDTMLASHVLDNRSKITGLKFQTFLNFGIPDYDSHIAPYLKAKGSNKTNRVMEAMSNKRLRKEMMLYCGLDSLYTYRLAEKQEKEISEAERKGLDLLLDGILAFADAEAQGMRIDVPYAERQKKKITLRIKRLEKELFESKLIRQWKHIYKNKFNYNSDLQMRKVLFEINNYKSVKETESGLPSVDEEAIKLLNIPELNNLLEIRKLTKLRDTYLSNYLEEQHDGFMHPSFNLHTVKTYRSSSHAPNFQNVPKRDKEAMKLIRSAIYPRKGHQLLEVDFSKLEVSIAATYHKDSNMMKYLTSSHNDMHGDMAVQIFKIKNFDKREPTHALLRGAAKNGFVFPQFYGDYYGNNAEGIMNWIGLGRGVWKDGQGVDFENTKISNHLISVGLESYDDFVQHLKGIENHFWNKRFKEYGAWKRTFWKQYQKQGYFDMHTGFRCRGVVGQNNALNYPVQGAAFHCLLWSFIEINKYLKEKNYKTKVIGQIHDAVVLDVYPPELKKVGKIVERITTKKLPAAWDWITAPLQVDAELCPVDGSWAEKEDYEL